MASLSLVTPPTTEPITLYEAKDHCRVPLNDEDELIQGYIVAEREWIEDVYGRQLILATWRLTRDGWPCWFDMPKPPLVGVDSIQYIDQAGGTQTLAADQYVVSKSTARAAGRGRIEPAYGVTWPTLRCQPDNVIVTFQAGYGTTPESVPQAIRQAMRLLIAADYQDREPTKQEWSAIRRKLTPYWSGSQQKSA